MQGSMLPERRWAQIPELQRACMLACETTLSSMGRAAVQSSRHGCASVVCATANSRAMHALPWMLRSWLSWRSSQPHLSQKQACGCLPPMQAQAFIPDPCLSPAAMQPVYAADCSMGARWAGPGSHGRSLTELWGGQAAARRLGSQVHKLYQALLCWVAYHDQSALFHRYG